MTISTVLVTGAAGGIGWTVTKQLLQRGCKVVAIDDYTTGMEREKADGVTWENVDISGDGFTKVLDKYPIDAVVHCAARLADQSLAFPVADTRTNALGSVQLFDWCARNKKIQRVLFTSSSGVYGNPPPRAIKETDTPNPGTIYAVNKIACENYLRILEKGYGLSWTVVRLFPTYGTAHKPSKSQGILNVMLTQLLEGNEVVSKGSLKRVRDLVFVEDTARAIVECLFSDKAKSKTFNVGTGKEYTVEQMIYFIAEAMGKKKQDIKVTEMEGYPGDPMYAVADVSLIRETIGFVPEFDLKQGIARMVAARLGKK